MSDLIVLGMLGVSWRRCLRGFELMAESKGISAAPGREPCYSTMPVPMFKTFILHYVQSLLPLHVRLLNRHFTAEVNTPYERYKLSQMYQGEYETINECVITLRQQIQNTGSAGG
jgi:hypothetical protein